MSRWVIKWNRRDSTGVGRPFDWATALSGPRMFECYGRAEGRGGETLANLQPGNVALAYQADDRTFHGVVRIITINSLANPPFLMVDRVHQFPRPVRWASIVANAPLLQDAPAFRGGSAAETIRKLSQDEYRLILESCGVDAAERTRLLI